LGISESIRNPQSQIPNPIARETVTVLSGVSHSSQRNYEERLGIEVRSNYAVGASMESVDGQEMAWEQGGALFTLKDYRGIQGKAGRSYYAWQLPNSYDGPHQTTGRGRQKHLNRQLADLRIKRDAGNGQRGGDACVNENAGNPQCPSQPQSISRLYHATPAQASHAYNRQPDQPAYWPADVAKGRWFVLEKQGTA